MRCYPVATFAPLTRKTALHFACAEGHDRVVEQLLKLGATAGR